MIIKIKINKKMGKNIQKYLNKRYDMDEDLSFLCQLAVIDCARDQCKKELKKLDKIFPPK